MFQTHYRTLQYLKTTERYNLKPMIKLNHTSTTYDGKQLLRMKIILPFRWPFLARMKSLVKDHWLERKNISRSKMIGRKREKRPSSSVNVFIIQQVALLTSLQQNITVFPWRKESLLVVVANCKVLDRYSKINFLMNTRNGHYSFKQQR